MFTSKFAYILHSLMLEVRPSRHRKSNVQNHQNDEHPRQAQIKFLYGHEHFYDHPCKNPTTRDSPTPTHTITVSSFAPRIKTLLVWAAQLLYVCRCQKRQSFITHCKKFVCYVSVIQACQSQQQVKNSFSRQRHGIDDLASIIHVL